MEDNKSTKTKNKNNFLIQGSILAVAGILVRLIGLAYRVPLRRIIGTEGMGYYSVAFEIYSIVLLLSSYSLPLAVSKMISGRLAVKDHKNAKRILKASLVYATVIGLLACIFVFTTADWFANIFYKLPLCKYAIISLAPTVWIMSYLGVLRGYFQGHSTMVPTALSQILEQLVNAIVSVGAAYWLCNKALKESLGSSVAAGYGAAGGTIGTGAGALSALVLLIILILGFGMKHDDRSAEAGVYEHETKSYYDITRVLFLTIIPVILSSAVYNINGIIDSSIYSNVMNARFGMEPSAIASDYGTFTGDFKTLANIPIAISNSLASSLIPSMVQAAALKDNKKVHEGITASLRYTVIIAMPAAIGLIVLGGPIVNTLFKGGELSATITACGAIGVLFYSVSTVTNAILQGNNYMRIPVKNSVISLAIHTVSLVILLMVFKLGIFSIVIAYIIFALCMCILNNIAMKNKLGYSISFYELYMKPFISSLVMGIVVLLVRIIIDRLTSAGSLVITVSGLIVAVPVYLFMIMATGCIKKEELKRIPLIKKFIS